MVTGSVFAAVSFVLRESELHGGLFLTGCELFAASGSKLRSAAGSSHSPGGWLHTSKTLLSDWAGCDDFSEEESETASILLGRQ